LRKTLREKCNQKRPGNGTSNKRKERNGTSGASSGKRKQSQDSTAAASTKSARRAKTNDDAAMQQRKVAATSNHVQRLEPFSSVCQVLSNLGAEKLSIEQRLQSCIRSRLEGITMRCFGKTNKDLHFIQLFEYLEEQFGIHEVASTFAERINVLEKLVG
jgi:hypothetical protein